MKIFLCLHVFLFTCLLAILPSCSQDQPVEKKFSLSDTVVPVNPNGDSELAKLMREMADYMVRTKKIIIAGDSLLPYPDQFSQIHTATATPGMVEKQTMRLFGSTYLSALKDLYKSKTTERKDFFNSAVKACVTCHESVCPGPLKRIGKLSIP